MTTIGERLQSVRKRRGFSQRELAQESEVSLSVIRKLEQGERSSARMATLRSLAVALGVPTTVLLGDSPPPALADDGAKWLPLRNALTEPAESHDLEPASEDGTASALQAAVKLYHDNRYDDLASVLPGLIRDAWTVSPLLRSRVLQLAGSLLVQTRQRGIARVALQRSLADAEQTGSVLDAASTIITLCWLLLLEAQFEQVRSTAVQWADRIEPKLSSATVAEISTWGWLLLRSSAAAIRDNRPDEAADMMRLAEAAAVVVGRDRGSYHTYWTTFGPATVAMKRVENAVIDGRPDVALRLAERVPTNLRPTSDNRNRHLLDVATAHLQLRHYLESLQVLQRLSDEAPVWLVNQRAAKDLVHTMISRRRTLSSDVRELADRIRLEY